MSSDMPELKLDRIDLLILDILRHDGRITNQALSERVNLTPRPCLERVRRLERSGVIKGYRAIIELEKQPLGLRLLVLVALSNPSGRASQKAFEALVMKTPQVVECHLISGTFEYSLKMRCRDLIHYRDITEAWLDDPGISIEKIVSHPELTCIKGPAF